MNDGSMFESYHYIITISVLNFEEKNQLKLILKRFEMTIYPNWNQFVLVQQFYDTNCFSFTHLSNEMKLNDEVRAAQLNNVVNFKQTYRM